MANFYIQRVSPDYKKNMGRLLSDLWTDDAKKQQFAADPKSMLAAYDITIPPDYDVEVLEDVKATDSYSGKLHFVIPVKPTGDIDETLLDEISLAAMGCCGDH